MALGTYTIPSDAGLAGSDDAKCKGEGKNGLQKDFEEAVNSILKSDEMKQLGYVVTMGYSGYVSKATAEDWSKKGNTPFLKSIEHFGWGLGWEVTKVNKIGKRGAVDMKGFAGSKDVMELFAKYGLVAVPVMSNKKLSLLYVRPGNDNLKKSSDVKELSYDASNVPSGVTGGETTSGDTSTSTSGSGSETLSSSMYFFANQFNAVVDTGMANMLHGVRALANDEPLWNYVKKAVNASLRSCSSDPDGNFIAWYPDYYGIYGNTPKTLISLVELQDLTITQSDEEFYSHVFCPGVNIDGSKMQMLYTQGVVAIETDDAAIAAEATVYKNNAAPSAVAGSNRSGGNSNPQGTGATAAADAAGVSKVLQKMIKIPSSDEWKYSPAELYRRYGARPAKTQSLPNFAGNDTLIENPIDNIEAENATRKSNKRSSGKTNNAETAKTKSTKVGSVEDANAAGASSDSSSDAGKKETNASSSSPNYLLPYLYALYEFMYHWANQYKAKVQVTFMPEVFPGSRIEVVVPDRDKDANYKKIEFYVQGVTHNMSYTGGFTTTLSCICPVGDLASGMVNVG